jgi:hypothetical protein
MLKNNEIRFEQQATYTATGFLQSLISAEKKNL